jgi:hypothetical protein
MSGQFGLRFRLPRKSQGTCTCRKSATWDRLLSINTVIFERTRSDLRNSRPVYMKHNTCSVAQCTHGLWSVECTNGRHEALAYPGRGGCGVQTPPRNYSELLKKSSRIPSSVENTSYEPNKNTGFTHLQNVRNPWLGGYRPKIPVLSALCPQLNLLTPPSPRKKILGTPLTLSESLLQWQSCFSPLCPRTSTADIVKQNSEQMNTHSRHHFIPSRPARQQL